MAEQLKIYVPAIIEIAFDLVVLLVTGLRLAANTNTDQNITYEFIPDRRIFTFRLLGKPSLGQSPPNKNYIISMEH